MQRTRDRARWQLRESRHLPYCDRRTATTAALIRVGSHVLTTTGATGTVIKKRFSEADHGTVYSVRDDESHHRKNYFRSDIEEV